MSKVAVIGTGAWGTALAVQAVRCGHHASLVGRDSDRVAVIRTTRENWRLPDVRLPERIDVRNDIPDDVELLLWVVPTQHLRASLIYFRPASVPMVICAKGVEASGCSLPLEVVEEACPVVPLAVLSGPNFAHEVAQGLPSAAVVSSVHPGLRTQVRTALGSPTFRLYGNEDPVGTQLGGAAKNVIAIAAGAVIGAGLGENARAALVTRGLSELRRLAVAFGGHADTVMGLSGLGDLLLTCTGHSSRNFSLGVALGHGHSLAQILGDQLAVTEGVTTAAGLVSRAQNVDLPICRAVADLLAGGKTLDQTIGELLLRPQRDE